LSNGFSLFTETEAVQSLHGDWLSLFTKTGRLTRWQSAEGVETPERASGEGWQPRLAVTAGEGRLAGSITEARPRRMELRLLTPSARREASRASPTLYAGGHAKAQGGCCAARVGSPYVACNVRVYRSSTSRAGWVCRLQFAVGDGFVPSGTGAAGRQGVRSPGGAGKPTRGAASPNRQS